MSAAEVGGGERQRTAMADFDLSRYSDESGHEFGCSTETCWCASDLYDELVRVMTAINALVNTCGADPSESHKCTSLIAAHDLALVTQPDRAYPPEQGQRP